MKKRTLNKFQDEALKALTKYEKKKNKGIVVLPSGAGKTYLAVEWFKRKLKKSPQAKLLFVCHNRDILGQAHENEFAKHIKQSNISYGYYVSTKKEDSQVVFATVQTLTRHLKEFSKEHFDYIIIDECHHYQASTFKSAPKYFNPIFMLSLTATPERMDGKDISTVLGKIVYERSFYDGIRNKLLVPLEYYCVENDFDFDGLEFNNWNYKEKELNKRFCVVEYDEGIIREYLQFKASHPDKQQTIGFCLTVEHAKRLSKVFSSVGISAEYLAGAEYTSNNTKSFTKRQNIIARYSKGETSVLFVCDLFNEGVDIPKTDIIMLFRPTQSETIYLQQIGRGLRKAIKKNNLLVLDFTGNSRVHGGFRMGIKKIFDIDVEKELAITEKQGEHIKQKKEVIVLRNNCKIHFSEKKINAMNRIFNRVVWTEELICEEIKKHFGNKPPRRKELYTVSAGAYAWLYRNGLVKKYCQKSAFTYYNENEIKNIISKKFKGEKPSRKEFKKIHPKLFLWMCRSNLADKYCKEARIKWDEKKVDELVKKHFGNRKSKRGDVYAVSTGAYAWIRRNNLFERYCLKSTLKHEYNDNKIKNIISKKFRGKKPGRKELDLEAPGAYGWARENKLLDKYCLKAYYKKGREAEIKKRILKLFDNRKPFRYELEKVSSKTYNWLRKKNLLDKYCLPSRAFRYTEKNIKQLILEHFGNKKPARGKLSKVYSGAYHWLRKGGLLDKYCLPVKKLGKICNRPHLSKTINIISSYKPKTSVPKFKSTKKSRLTKGENSSLGNWVTGYKEESDGKQDMRKKIISNIKDRDTVLMLESPELSAIKEIEKQGISPKRIVIPNNLEFNKLRAALQKYKTNLKIELVNTSALQYLTDSNDKFDFLWLDYCGGFTYYTRDIDALFQKQLSDMRLIVTCNVFDVAKDNDAFYLTRVIDYVLGKVNGRSVRLLNDITCRYKKNMYNVGFSIQG